MDLLNDVWQHLLLVINWVIFLLVIASGYFVRVTPILKNHSTTIKVLFFSSSVTILYAILTKVDAGTFIASYFIAFGFHSAILKVIERFLNKQSLRK